MLEIKGDKFYLDGKEFHIYSGVIHYFRILPEYWEDRLLKLKACGFNTVETYVAWNALEPKKGEFNFEGINDLAKFLKIAQKVGLYAIVRPGPYICAEWEFGGLPAWLLKDKNTRLRCMDETYLGHVKDYYKELLSRINDMQITKGGNIIAMQVENEYGSYGNDKEYLRYIQDLMTDCGVEVLLFTSDGDWCNMLSGGSLPDTYKVINFGSGVSNRFNSLKGFQDNAPKMCGEFWCGWFDHFGEKHHVRGANSVIGDIKKFIELDASFNMYMFHGGTNFGFYSGANHAHVYQPTTTSYDYCAPLSEHGEYTPVYHELRKLMHESQGLELGTLPPSPKVQNVGNVKLTQQASLWNNLDNIGTKHHSGAPEYMEHYDQNYGMILYHTKIEGKYVGQVLTIDGIHDIAYIYRDGKQIARFDRTETKGFFKRKGTDKLERLTGGFNESMELDILVDAMGRVNYGQYIYDHKGISNVRFGAQNIFTWDVTCLPLDNIDKVVYDNKTDKYPLFLKGNFKADNNGDCFVDMSGFTKGYVWVNGFNLGRYWKKGPQKALYLPSPLLKGDNEIVILEQEGCSDFSINITDKPNLG